MSQMIGLINQKGGVGKSTTTATMAAALAERENPPAVLVVDLDAQGHACKALGVPKNAGPTVASVLWDDLPACDAVRPSRLPGVDVIAASSRLGDYDISVATLAEEQRARVVADALAPVRDDYDYVLLDMPPSRGQIQIAAYMAADWLVAPTKAEADAVAGLIELMETVERAQRRLHAPARLLGVLLTEVDWRTLEHRQNALEVREHLGDLVFDTAIRQTTRVREATRHKRTVLEFAPDSTAAADYRHATDEMIRRIAERRV